MTEPQKTPKAKILIVEDEAIIALDLKNHLEQSGYKVFAPVNSGEKALELIEQDPPDLVLIDIVLKGKMDGIEAADIIRSRWGVPVIFTTAYADMERIKRAKLTYPFGYLMKPYLDRDIDLTIEMALYVSRVDGERRKAEAALLESEETYRLTFSSTSDIIYTIDLELRITSISPSVEKILGYKVEELINRPFQDLNLLPPESLKMAVSDTMRVLSGEQISAEVYEFIAKDGTRRWGEISGSPLIHDGKVIGLTSVARDITDRKQTEDRLRAERQRFLTLSENSPLGLILLDADGKFTYTNFKFKEIFGYDLADVPDGKTWFQKAYPDPEYRRTVISAWINDLEESGPGQKRPRVFTVTCKDGTKKIIHFTPVQLETSEQIISFEDITERNQVEEDLHRSEERYRTIIEGIEDGYFEVDIKGNMTFCNPSTARILGYTPAELLGMNNRQYMDAENAQMVFATFNTVYKTGRPTKTFDWTLIRKGGEKLIVETSISLIRDTEGQPMGFRGIFRDITERKQMEEKLRQSEERYRTIIEQMEDGYFEIDLAGNFTFVNDAECRNLGYSREELIGMSNRQFTDEKNAKTLYRLFNEIYNTGIPVKAYDLELIKKGGVKSYDEISASLIRNTKGEPIGFRGIARDVTERNQAEERIKTSLKEKEVLLREVHHRVKNNLAVIASILRLQSRYVQDEKALEILRDCESRAKTMAKIHAKLYQSGDVAHVDFDAYLRELTNELFQSYQISPEAVTLDVQIADYSPAIDTAIPLSLIINELLSNSLKYAFPEGRKGEIQVALREKDGQMVLMVADNGFGFPKKVDFTNTKSMGLQLVMALVDQLDGTIEMKRDQGTVFTITFKE